jgi:hypothetical protein
MPRRLLQVYRWIVGGKPTLHKVQWRTREPRPVVSFPQGKTRAELIKAMQREAGK